MNRKVLILEDEVIVAMDIAAELSDAGWTVIGPAGTVEKAESISTAEKPDAAVLDINVNGVKSFDLATRLREQGVGVIFLTGYSANSIPADLGDCPIISKPVNFRSVIAALEAIVSAE
ncbi:response regulator [Tropicimonas isoalkanivorans]|uniref:Response regulator receiver domain-containing protein n=1 Tax=Tropicimonas isoalkanivorans TaxID=441112 RepID=A0A1I1HQ92_9RHOB|nr:response regulator [Tropicimonas isoalkanivorans]SFC26094.1 Response regulator receiver domain-containing protein [Tropicimonas isoalkanivorans]